MFQVATLEDDINEEPETFSCALSESSNNGNIVLSDQSPIATIIITEEGKSDIVDV